MDEFTNNFSQDTNKASEQINEQIQSPAEDTFSPQVFPSHSDANPQYPPVVPVNNKHRVKFPFGYFAIILVVCIVISSLSGAGGAFFMYKAMQPVSEIPEASTVEEFDMEEILSDEAEASENASSEEENTFTPVFNEETTTAEPVTEEPVTSPPPLTKGDIYANAVNSIVAITAQWEQPYSVLFGTYTKTYATTGTGFAVTSSGYIATNYHVVEKGTTIIVKDYYGNEYPAVLVGSEPSNDVAIIKIEAETVPVTLGKSSELKVGDDIMIIGNALGELSYSFTDGIVSHLSRNVKVESGEVIHMFQTNAAINNGNSGGPVYNMDGEVVGIASAKYASDTIEGLGFCIPIDDVIDMISDIMVYGYVTGKPALGVSLQSINDATAVRYSIPTGCYVVDIDESSSAFSMGLRPGDVITALDGSRVSSCEDLSSLLASYNANSQVKLSCWRETGEFSIDIKLGEKKPTSPRTDYSNVYDF